MFSEDSLPLLANSECNLINDNELSCVSQEIEGILVNYGTSPATISGINAPIEFRCSPKDGSYLTNQWTIDTLIWVRTQIPDPTSEPTFDYSACNHTNWALDSYCDDATNTPECNFDSGACCGDNVDKSFCLECECKETCPLSRSISSDRTDKCYGKNSIAFNSKTSNFHMVVFSHTS